MIIGFDASRAFGSNRTGTENYSYQLLLNLAKIDHKNQYKVFLRSGVLARGDDERGAPRGGPALASGVGNAWGCESAGPRAIDWPKNFEFITIPYPRLWTQAGLAKQTFLQNLDVLFIPSHTLPLIRKPGLKTVVTVHDLGAEYLPKTHQLKQRLYLNFMTHHQLKSADHIIAVSNAAKDDLVKKVHLNPKNISVIYEGYDKLLFKPQKTDELNSVLNYYELESNNYFLFVGTIQPRKNLERLIKAYSIFLQNMRGVTQRRPARHRYAQALAGGDLGRRPQVSETNEDAPEIPKRQDPEQEMPKLVLAGNKGWMSEEIYKLPKKLGIENQVKFLGYVPDENLPALYNGAIAFLFPSLFEGFGLPVLEAMACECPVLTSNISSLPEVAGSAALLINPYSEKEIAQGILKLFSDQNLRNRLKKLGIAQCKKFSWEKCARETLLVLEREIRRSL